MADPVAAPGWTAWGLAAGRVALGVGAVACPGLVVRIMVGDAGKDPTVIMLARLAGIRDVVLGMATLDALHHGRNAAPLLWAGSLGDLADGVLTFRQPGMRARNRVPATAMAWLAAVAGAWRATRPAGDPGRR